MNTNTQFITEIVRTLRAELYKAKRKAGTLNATDEAQLFYSGVVVGLQVSIGKYEQWLYNVKPKTKKSQKNKQGGGQNAR